MGPAAEVDRVEWLPASAREIEVRVVGRSASIPRRKPVLVVPGERGESIEFRGDVEAGAPRPQTGERAWAVSFAIPLELRPRLARGLVLRWGSSRTELPAAVTGGADPDAPHAPAQVIDRAVLAERRARRAELNEAGLARRASVAEAQAANLESQLAHLEQRLAEAAAERDRAQEELARRERELRAARQREYAEQRGRVDAEEQLARAHDRARAELAELRDRHEEAEQRAEALTEEVERLRRDTAEAQHAVRTEAHAAVADARDALARREQEISRTQAELQDQLGRVQAAERRLAGLRSEVERGRDALAARRAELERDVAGQRRQAAARVDELERALAEREQVQGQLTAELDRLRDELAHIRERSDEEVRRHDAAEAMLSDLRESTGALQAQLAVLEARRREAEQTADALRDQLARRDGELLALGVEAERHRVEAERNRLEADRARAEAEAHGRGLAEAQAALEGQMAATERDLQDRIVRQRDQFEAQVGAVQEAVAVLGGQLDVAAREVERHREAERAAQRRAAELEQAAGQAAEAQRVAEERAAETARLAHLQAEEAGRTAQQRIAEAQAASDRREQAALEEVRRAREQAARVAETAREYAREAQRVAQERIRAATEEGRAEGREALRRLREELAEVRALAEARAGREAELEKLVAELTATAGSLREAFTHEVADLQRALDERPATAGAGFDRDLGEIEKRVGELREQLFAEARRLQEALEVERAARAVAEAELAAAREHLQTRGARAEELRHAAAQARAEAEEQAQAQLGELRTRLEQRARAEFAARAEVATLQSELEHLRGRPPAVRQPSGDAARKLVADLTEAVARLRERIPPEAGEEEEAPGAGGEARVAGAWVAGGAVEGEAGREEDAGVQDEVRGEEGPGEEVAHEEAGVEEAAREAGVEEKTGREEEAGVQDNAGDGPGGVTGGPARAAGTLSGPRTPWLTRALERMAVSDDAQLAARLILDLLPIQASRFPGELTYALRIDELGGFLVHLDHGRAEIGPLPAAHEEVEFELQGPAARMAVLAAGASGRRLPGVALTGKRRRLRKLLRALRQPIGLADLVEAGVRADPGLLLAVVTGAIDPAWTVGHSFTVEYRLRGAGETHSPVRIEVADGAAVRVSAGAVTLEGSADAPGLAPATATMTVDADTLAAMLARIPLAPGRRPAVDGRGEAASILGRWLDRAQGISGPSN